MVKTNLKRLSVALILGLVLLLMLPIQAFAIADPDTLTINSVFAYRHCLETDDQLYLVEYTVDYTVNPDENITEAFLCRLMNGATELGSVAPYAYYDLGYDRGVIALYFSAAEVTAKSMTWEGSYTMRLEGNPVLAWEGDPPYTISASFNSWSSSTSITTTQNELAARLLYLGGILETLWSVDMVETSGGSTYLTSYGEAYFAGVLENLTNFVPNIFSSGTITPDYEVDEIDPAYAEELAAGTTDTPLDTSELATIFGISEMWMSTLLYLIGALIFLYFILRHQAGSFKPAIMFSTPLLVAGALLGMLPLTFVVLIAFAALALTAFVLFYLPSGA